MHVLLNEIGPTGPRVLNDVSIRLDCTKSGPGQINWEPKTKIIHFDGVKIECLTADLREIGLELSDGNLDICDGQSECELPIVNIINYVNMPIDACATYFAVGELLVYEEVKLGMNGLVGSNYQILLGINGQQLTASVPPTAMEQVTGIAIEQRGNAFDFAANAQLVASPVASNPVTYFNSWPTPLFFGYDPETEDYFDGCVKEGIYDPLSGVGFVH